MLSVIKLIGVNGEPVVKLELPSLRVGDPVVLRFRLERKTAGRTEVLDVGHRFRVISVGFDASSRTPRQVLTVEVADVKAPTWRSVKKRPEGSRRLSPAVSGRTPV